MASPPPRFPSSVRFAAAILAGALALASAVLLPSPGGVRAASHPPAAACGPAERARLLAPARPGDDVATLTCSLRLEPGDHVTRRILIEGREASGVTLDCNGASLGGPADRPAFGAFVVEVRSRRLGADDAPRWEPPTDVVLRGCTVYGHVRVWGMGLNGQGPDLRSSSHSLGHTERAQAAAPTRIAILDSRLEALGGIPLYVAPGVTAFTLRGSHLGGRSASVALYLDAESGANVIEGNSFDVRTGREVMAVDGSAFNRIRDNRFVLYGEGGIRLYRNCGEGGTVRHQTPSDNVITGNRFRQAGAFFRFAPIVVGSREGFALHCGEDAGYPFGSSADDGDHAERNVVEGNREE